MDVTVLPRPAICAPGDGLAGGDYRKIDARLPGPTRAHRAIRRLQHRRRIASLRVESVEHVPLKCGQSLRCHSGARHRSRACPRSAFRLPKSAKADLGGASPESITTAWAYGFRARRFAA